MEFKETETGATFSQKAGVFYGDMIFDFRGCWVWFHTSLTDLSDICVLRPLIAEESSYKIAQERWGPSSVVTRSMLTIMSFRRRFSTSSKDRIYESHPKMLSEVCLKRYYYGEFRAEKLFVNEIKILGKTLSLTTSKHFYRVIKKLSCWGLSTRLLDIFDHELQILSSDDIERFLRIGMIVNIDGATLPE